MPVQTAGHFDSGQAPIWYNPRVFSRDTLASGSQRVNTGCVLRAAGLDFRRFDAEAEGVCAFRHC